MSESIRDEKRNVLPGLPNNSLPNESLPRDCAPKLTSMIERSSSEQTTSSKHTAKRRMTTRIKECADSSFEYPSCQLPPHYFERLLARRQDSQVSLIIEDYEYSPPT
jgi:hypothetical protein